MKNLIGYFQFNVGTTTYRFSLYRCSGEYGMGIKVGDNYWRKPIPFYELFNTVKQFSEHEWSSVNYECDS